MNPTDETDNWWEIVTVRSRLRIMLNPDDVVEIRSPEGTLAYLSRAPASAESSGEDKSE